MTSKAIFAFFIAGLLIFIGLAFYPTISDMLGVDTSGFSDMLKAGVTSLPYLLGGLIIIGAIWAWTKRG